MAINESLKRRPIR